MPRNRQTERQPLFVKSRVIKAGYQVQPYQPEPYQGESVQSASQGRGGLKNLDFAPKGVLSGRILMESASDEEKVRVKYRPEGYGLVHVESAEEKELRYQAEIQALQTECEEREKAGLKKGMQQGHKKGLEEGRNEVANEMQKMSELLQATRDATNRYFRDVEDEIADFAIAIARRIVGDCAEEKREVAQRLAAGAIQAATEKTRIRLIVNKEDFDTLQNARADLMTLSEGIKEIEVDVSPRLKPGDVLLETAGGSIDATVETMLDEIHKALKPGYEGANGNGGNEP